MPSLARPFLLAALLGLSSQAHAGGCSSVYRVWAIAVADGVQERFLELQGEVFRCLGEEAGGLTDASDAVRYLKAQSQAGERVRSEAYQGYLKAHPLVAEAALALVDGLSPYAATVYVSSMVRTPEHQLRLLDDPVLGPYASRRSKHVMGGLAVDLAFRERQVDMETLGARAREVLVDKLGERKAGMLGVLVEPYNLHIGVTESHIIEERKEELLALGILRVDSGSGVPDVDDYVSEADWVPPELVRR